MKQFPLLLLFLLVPGIALVGLWDSARQDRIDESLEAVDKSLLHKLDRQHSAFRRELASLRSQLTVSQAEATALRKSLESLLGDQRAEAVARDVEADWFVDQIDDMAAVVAGNRVATAQLRHDIQTAESRLGRSIQTEREARESFEILHETSANRQNELLTAQISLVQRMADGHRARAVAETELAAAAAEHAADLARLSQRTLNEGEIMAGEAESTEGIRVAEALQATVDAEFAGPAEPTDQPIESNPSDVPEPPGIDE